MDATYFRDKAETCLRLAKGLSWNNPARGELMELAEEFQRQAEELKATRQQPPPPDADFFFSAQSPAVGKRPARNITTKNFPAFSKD